MNNENTYIVIMAGGFGRRFWPMSQADNPKQFNDIMGTGQSMLQATFARFERICPRQNIIIVTGELYVARVREQIPDLKPYQVLGEPSRRNTAPCIAYAAAVIHSLNPDAVIVVSPSDHAIFDDEAFVSDINNSIQVARHHDWIVTVGVRPTAPNTSYGYIQFAEGSTMPSLHKAVTFTEKPPVDVAQQFIASGEFLWNTGIFIWRLPVLVDAYRRYLPLVADSFFPLSLRTTRRQLNNVYSVAETISVDFGIMEKADNVYVIRASFGWSDVETWESLYSTVPHDDRANAIVSGNVFSYDVSGCVVHVPSDKTVVLQGLDGYIIAGNNDTILVCRRDQEERLFNFSSDVELFKLTQDNNTLDNEKN
ncbi:MAG: mannose-1-phosphate guanylyltransferase [bacterium P3]|nr:MAG: mannose-1-phosphate guanylyltransferase [bacterium P3]KWW40764.1 MAG: mannose-1-phosphate guanylyltransferase [bacterium F083]